MRFKLFSFLLPLLFSSCIALAQPAPEPIQNQASDISTNTSAFNNNLSAADNTVQKALETLDEVTGGGGVTINTTSPMTGAGVGSNFTLGVDQSLMTLSSIGGAVTDGQVPDNITITETDPQVGAVTLDKWCKANGTTIECDQNAPAGGTPGGSSPQIQFNNGGSFGGVSGSGADPNGNIGIGTTGPVQKLQVVGTINATTLVGANVTSGTDPGHAHTAYLTSEVDGSTTNEAPLGADYLVGTADPNLTNEIAIGTTPGGELGNTWANPTVDATHSGSAHHAAVTVSGTPTYLTLSGQDLIRGTIDISDHTNLTAGDALTITGDDIDFDGGATPAGDLGGTWANPSVSDDSHAHTTTTISGLLDADMGNDALDPDKIVGDATDDNLVDSSIVEQNVGTDINTDLEEETHGTEHNGTDSDYITDSGDTLEGELTVDDLGLEFGPGDTLSSCATFSATGGGIFYDDSEGKFKKCQDNVLTDLDTGGGGGDSISVDAVAVVDPNFASTGDIDVVDTSNTITWNINANSILYGDMSFDAAVADGDYVTTDLTGTNFNPLSPSEVLTDIGAQPLESTLTDIADGTIAEDLVNTAFPWADNEVADNLTASNYLPLSGGVLTGEATVDNLGLEFTPGDDHSNCAAFSATGGGIFYDDSEGVFKKCQDNVLTVLDTGGSEVNNLETLATGIAVNEVPTGTAADTAVYKLFPSCDVAGSALNYNTSTQTWSCRSGLGGVGSSQWTTLEGVGIGTTDPVGIGTYGASSQLEIVKVGENHPLMVSATPTGDGNYMIITSHGYVGIGTNSPEKKLVVRAGAGEEATFRLQATDADVGFGEIGVRNDLNDEIVIGKAPSSADDGDNGRSYIYATGDFPLIIYTNATERMRIMGTGNVGIGTVSPSQMFSVGTTSQFRVTNAGIVTAPEATVSTVLDIPSGTGPTVDAAGETAIDTTTDQFIYYGGAKRVLHYEYLNCGALQSATNVTVANNYPIFTAPAAGTIVAVSCQVTGTSATIDFEDDADTNIEAALACDVSSPSAWDEAIAGTATFVKGEAIEFDVTAASAATSLLACVRWVRDAD